MITCKNKMFDSYLKKSFAAMKLFAHGLLLATIAMTASSCNRHRPHSADKGVEIAQTDVQDQGGVGLCWAYATIGLIESNYKMETQTGDAINLSEEGLAFYNMSQKLLGIATIYRKKRSDSNLNPVEFGTLLDGVEFGKLLIRIDGGHVGDWDHADPTESANGGLQIATLNGVIPESEWTYKFATNDDYKAFLVEVRQNFKELLQSSENITQEAIEKTLVRTPAQTAAFPSSPPKNFRFNGANITAADFAKNVLKINSNEFAKMTVKSAGDAPVFTPAATLVSAIKATLARGISVPLAFVPYANFLKSGTYSIPGNASPSTLPESAGGHAVLITDFVNTGSQEGALSMADLKSQLAKGFDDLNYIVIKNSWGSTASQFQGYHHIDRSYIEALDARGYMKIIVPADIAANPFAAPTINPKVTNGQ